MRKVVAIVVVIIILAGGGYAIAKHNKNSGSSTSTTSSGTTASSGSSSTQSSSTGSSGSSTATQTNAVTIDNFAFSPADINVKKGTAVTWTNKDSVAHTVTETDGQDGPKSNDLNQNDTYTFTYNTTGTFKYHCSIHPNMVGTVTVTD